MQRRHFLKLGALGVAGTLAADFRLHADALPAQGEHAPRPNDGRPHRFSFGKRQFLLDGKPFQIKSGEMHPIRIPPEYWRQRIRMAKAMGLNTVSLYLMWNAYESEPGVFDMTSGARDFVRFIRLCAEEGMWVYLRPGPFVAGEWDFGGLPPYLLRDPTIVVRTRDDARYMAAVRRYFDHVAPRIAPLLVANGGPILMLQIENEYASYGRDLGYLEVLRQLWLERGIDGPFSISDGLSQIQSTHTYLPGVALGLDGDTDFDAAQVIAGDRPVWMGEGYPGWISSWGEKDFPKDDFEPTLKQLLAAGRSFNLYVVHGGTNFGLTASGISRSDGSGFSAVTTSYDYGSPINEHGAPAPAYHRFRALLAQHSRHSLPEVPATPPIAGFDPVQAKPVASLWDLLPAPQKVHAPRSNEELFAQNQGMVLYRKRVRGRQLQLTGVHDYATVFTDGDYVDYVSRVVKPGLHTAGRFALDGKECVLDLLIDSFGHIGNAQIYNDRKGLVGSAQLDGQTLLDWDVYSLPVDDALLQRVRNAPAPSALGRPGLFFRAEVTRDVEADAYMDMSAWRKGYLWVNGHLLGRYWNLGPQQRLYCPAPWWRKGVNEILVLDFHRTRGAAIGGATSLHD